MPAEPLPLGGRRSTALDFNLGKVYVLAGRAAAAIPHLARVTTACTTLDGTMLVQRARWFLGQAYEAIGDATSARAAYDRILATWPSASGSRTRARAEQRRKALGGG